VAKPAARAGGDAAETIGPDRFVCDDALCVIDAGGGRIVAHAQTMAAAHPACAVARLIVIADPTAANPCPGSAAVVVTARRLALRGSAEISFGPDGRPVVTHAIREGGARPWHDHRRFSREARGLETKAPKKEKAGAEPAS
jgi:competence protein ComEC